MADSTASELRFYIGTYTRDSDSKGIYTALLDGDSGRMKGLELAAPAENPSFLASSPDGRFLYASEEAGTGQIASFATDSNGNLRPLNTRSTRGSGACHVWVDAAGKYVFSANYGGGSAIVFPIAADGSLEEASDFVKFEGSGSDANRQKQPHAHSVYSSKDSRFLYVCDLGTDKVHTFRLDGGKLIPLEPGQVPPGSGPRHLAFSADEQFAYVCNEMGLTVTAFSRDPESGLLTPLQTVPLLPDSADPEGATASEIYLHPDGRWLYVSNRGHDSFTVYEAEADGTLTVVQNVPSEVGRPRGFGIDPSGRWLIAAGEADDQLRVFSIDPATGSLTVQPGTIRVGTPVDVLFAPTDDHTR